MYISYISKFLSLKSLKPNFIKSDYLRFLNIKLKLKPFTAIILNSTKTVNVNLKVHAYNKYFPFLFLQLTLTIFFKLKQCFFF